MAFRSVVAVMVMEAAAAAVASRKFRVQFTLLHIESNYIVINYHINLYLVKNQ